MIEDFILKIAEQGVIGVILAWFMLRVEKILKENNRLLALVHEKLRGNNGRR